MDILMRIWLLPILAVWIGCSGKTQWNDQFVAIDNTLDSFVMQEKMILTEVDKLWDTTTMVLEKSIPADFPAVDRNIFLTSRNADHITMFKSFELLDSATQRVIFDAKEKDAMLAKKLMQLMDERKKIDTEMKQFIASVAQSDPTAAKEFAARFQTKEYERSNTDNH